MSSAAPPQFKGSGGGDGGGAAGTNNNASSPGANAMEGGGGNNANYGGGGGHSMDAARLMMMQQQHPQQSEALRRLSIDTIGSSQRSFGASGNPLRLNPQQPQPRTTADWQLLLAQQQQQGGGLPSSQMSRAGNLALDPAAAVALDAAAQWRLQQQQQALLGPASSLQLFGSQPEAPNANSNANNNNNSLEMDLLYRTLLQQQQQQQQQQSDSLLNLSRQQQLIHDFALQQNQNQQLTGGAGGADGLDPNLHGGGNHFDLAQQYRTGLRQDPLDWSRNSNANHPNTFDAATLLALQQQQQPLHFPHTSHATSNFNSTSRMALEEQLAMMNALQQQQQQQNSMFFGGGAQQPHASSFYSAGGANIGHAVGDGLDHHHHEGAGSTSLLSALFAESAVPSLPDGHSGGTFAHHPGAARQVFPGNTSKKSKASAANADSASQLPVRALSAYNFFFRDERDRIISSDDGEDLGETDPVDPERLLRRRQAVPLDATKKKQLLSGHWYRDRSVKRRHRKTHGKIAFTALSKVISQAWRDLPEADKAFYRDVAAEDLERYQREVEQLKFNDAAGRPSMPPSAVVKNESDDLENATGV